MQNVFGFNTLEIDGSSLFYAGKRQDIDALLGSKDEAVKTALYDAGKHYRSGKDKRAYSTVVDEIIDIGKSRSPIRYEVFAQIYRLQLRLVFKTQAPLYLSDNVLSSMSQDLNDAYRRLTSWRDYQTGKTTKTMSYDSYLTTSYLTNEELHTLIHGLRQLIGQSVLADVDVAKNLGELLPYLESIESRSEDVFIVQGGYVPKKLKPMSW